VCSKRDVVVFLAGAEAFHTLSHMVIQFTSMLPVTVWGIHWTPQLNLFGIVINGVITLGLLWWASKLK